MADLVELTNSLEVGARRVENPEVGETGQAGPAPRNDALRAPMGAAR